MPLGQFMSALAVALVVLIPGGCPVEVRPADRPDEKSTSIEVIESQNTTLAIVPVHIGKRGPYEFLLDTGASASAIDRNLAQELDLEFTGDVATISGVTANAEVEIVDVDRWRIGKTELESGEITAPDLQQGGGFDGLIGSDQLSEFGRVTVDYERERLTLGDA